MRLLCERDSETFDVVGNALSLNLSSACGEEGEEKGNRKAHSPTRTADPGDTACGAAAPCSTS